MLNKMFSKLSHAHQGILALIMGLILVLGSLGKLGILQSVLNTIMIGVGLILVFWGVDKSNGLKNLQNLLKKK